MASYGQRSSTARCWCWRDCWISRSQLDSLGSLFAELVADLGVGLGTELLKVVLCQILGELGDWHFFWSANNAVNTDGFSRTVNDRHDKRQCTTCLSLIYFLHFLWSLCWCFQCLKHQNPKSRYSLREVLIRSKVHPVWTQFEACSSNSSAPVDLYPVPEKLAAC